MQASFEEQFRVIKHSGDRIKMNWIIYIHINRYITLRKGFILNCKYELKINLAAV